MTKDRKWLTGLQLLALETERDGDDLERVSVTKKRKKKWKPEQPYCFMLTSDRATMVNYFEWTVSERVLEFMSAEVALSGVWRSLKLTCTSHRTPVENLD